MQPRIRSTLLLSVPLRMSLKSSWGSTLVPARTFFCICASLFVCAKRKVKAHRHELPWHTKATRLQQTHIVRGVRGRGLTCVLRWRRQSTVMCWIRHTSMMCRRRKLCEVRWRRQVCAVRRGSKSHHQDQLEDACVCIHSRARHAGEYGKEDIDRYGNSSRVERNRRARLGTCIWSLRRNSVQENDDDLSFSHLSGRKALSCRTSDTRTEQSQEKQTLCCPPQNTGQMSVRLYPQPSQACRRIRERGHRQVWKQLPCREEPQSTSWNLYLELETQQCSGE